MNCKWTMGLLLSLSLFGCSAPTIPGIPTQGTQDDTAHYDEATHTLLTHNGQYKIYFPGQPSAIPGQKIIYQSRIGMGSGFSKVSDFSQTQRANFEWSGGDLKLTAMYWEDGEPSMDTARIPGEGHGYTAFAPSMMWRTNAKRHREAWDSMGNSDDLFRKTRKLLKTLNMTESSSRFFKSAEGFNEVEATAADRGADALKLNMYFNQKNRKFYLLIAEGPQSRIDGPEANQFFNSFAYVPYTRLTRKEQEELEDKSQYKEQHSARQNFFSELFKFKNRVHSTSLCDAISQHGLTSTEVQNAIKETFTKPPDRGTWAGPYAKQMQEQLGSDYHVVGKMSLMNTKIFDERDKHEQMIDVSSTKADGKALAIFLDKDWKYEKSVVHPTESALVDNLVTTITTKGVDSPDVSTSLYQSFTSPISGVRVEDLVDALRDGLGPDYAVNDQSPESFHKSILKPADSVSFEIQDKKNRKTLQFLLNQRGQLLDIACRSNG